MENFIEKYIDFIKLSIEEEGINPTYAWLINEKNEMTVMSFGEVSPEDIYSAVLTKAAELNAAQFIFGLDRYNKEGQGVADSFKSVFTIAAFDSTKSKNAAIVVLPYNSPNDIGEPQYNNEWWSYKMAKEIVCLGRALVKKRLQAEERQSQFQASLN